MPDYFWDFAGDSAIAIASALRDRDRDRAAANCNPVTNAAWVHAWEECPSACTRPDPKTQLATVVVVVRFGFDEHERELEQHAGLTVGLPFRLGEEVTHSAVEVHCDEGQ